MYNSLTTEEKAESTPTAGKAPQGGQAVHPACHPGVTPQGDLIMSASSPLLQYPRPLSKAEANAWASTREISADVAQALHAIEGAGRHAHAIWDEPTWEEFEAVQKALDNYILSGEAYSCDPRDHWWGGEYVLPELAEAMDEEEAEEA